MIDGWVNPISMCQLLLPGFEGSAEDFLALVVQHKLAADEVPVADVTRQFLVHMNESEYLDLDRAGDLMAVSARLMLMKSSQLLTQPDFDEGGDERVDSVFDPSPRQRFQVAIDSLSGREGGESFTPFTAQIEIERRFEPRSPNLLVRAWNEMIPRAGTPDRRVTVPGFVRLEVAVSGLIRAFRSTRTLVFRQLIQGCNRNDTVVHFMAMLELVRQRRLRAEQGELFSEITMHWIEDHAESSSRLG
jgi:segregation and condensation protein A